MFSTLLNWFMGRLGRAACTLHLISAQTSQEGMECSKAKRVAKSLRT